MMNTKIEPITHASHKGLRIRVDHRFEHVKDRQFIPMNANEFGYGSTSYPLFFIKDGSTGKFFPVALFGLDKGENIFYSKDRWQASYIPRLMAIEPFSISTIDADSMMASFVEKGGGQQAQLDSLHDRSHENQDSLDSKKKDARVVICINRASASILSDSQDSKNSEALFEKDKESAYLQRMGRTLVDLHNDKLTTLAFIERLLSLELIQPVQLNLMYENGEKRAIGGLYAIDSEAVKEMSPKTVQEFHSKGYFPSVYAMQNSQHNLYELIKKKRDLGGRAIKSLQVAKSSTETDY